MEQDVDQMQRGRPLRLTRNRPAHCIAGQQQRSVHGPIRFPGERRGVCEEGRNSTQIPEIRILPYRVVIIELEGSIEGRMEQYNTRHSEQGQHSETANWRRHAAHAYS